jgi:hypothetical protein
MCFLGEQRWLELRFVVTGVAIGTRRACGELILVNVLVAIFAKFVRDGPLKIAIFVALRAGELGVPAIERKLGRLVVEPQRHRAVLPSSSRMAGLAGSLKLGVLKCSLVRIGMAVLAGGIWQSSVFCFRHPWFGTVTFFARYVLVQTRQRKSGAEMIKAPRRLPGVLRVAAKTIGSQLAHVLIFVARCAFLVQPQECLIEIFDLYFGARGCWDFGLIVAALTSEPCVLAFQREPCESLVIECLLIIEPRNRKLPAVVL